MKKLCIYIWLFFPLWVFGNTFTQIEINSHKVEYINYSTNSEIHDIQIGLSEEGSSLRKIIKDYQWVSGINGVFFCPDDYSRCNGNSTINERFIQGKEITTYKSTGERVVFWWDSEQNPFLHQTDKINPGKRSEIYEWFANFPLLLQSGKNTLEHYYDVGLIGNKMRRKLTRHFVCSTKEWKNILFGTISEANMDDMVPVLLKIGCHNALNLDAGWSSAFIYNGRNRRWPGREVLDGIVISRKDIDTKTIDTTVEKVFEKITKNYLKKSNTEESISLLQSYRDAINTTQKKIYSTHQTQIYDQYWDTIGYTLPSLPKNTFKKIYILNTIDAELRALIKKL